ncbi:hypothetical protein FRC00_006320 [Tulasnella sp. 408]|nr:hypothetical protein FRC00_006320 [Tulasnella sp. 408]
MSTDPANRAQPTTSSGSSNKKKTMTHLQLAAHAAATSNQPPEGVKTANNRKARDTMAAKNGRVAEALLRERALGKEFVASGGMLTAGNNAQAQLQTMGVTVDAKGKTASSLVAAAGSSPLSDRERYSFSSKLIVLSQLWSPSDTKPDTVAYFNGCSTTRSGSHRPTPKPTSSSAAHRRSFSADQYRKPSFRDPFHIRSPRNSGSSRQIPQRHYISSATSPSSGHGQSSQHHQDFSEQEAPPRPGRTASQKERASHSTPKRRTANAQAPNPRRKRQRSPSPEEDVDVEPPFDPEDEFYPFIRYIFDLDPNNLPGQWDVRTAREALNRYKLVRLGEKMATDLRWRIPNEETITLLEADVEDEDGNPLNIPEAIRGRSITKTDLQHIYGFGGNTTWWTLGDRWKKSSLKGAKIVQAWVEDPDAIVQASDGEEEKYQHLNRIPFSKLKSVISLDCADGNKVAADGKGLPDVSIVGGIPPPLADLDPFLGIYTQMK